MSKECFCANCRHCDEVNERSYFCDLFEAVVSGRGYCNEFEFYPNLAVL